MKLAENEQILAKYFKRINHVGLYLIIHYRKAIMTVFKQSNGFWFVFITAIIARRSGAEEGFDEVYENKPNAI